MHPDNCNGCGACVDVCPFDCISPSSENLAGYLPALAFDWLPPARDFVAGTLFPQQTTNGNLLRGADIGPGHGHRVLYVGCGTGTLYEASASFSYPSASRNGSFSRPGMM